MAFKNKQFASVAKMLMSLNPYWDKATFFRHCVGSIILRMAIGATSASRDRSFTNAVITSFAMSYSASTRLTLQQH